MTDTAYNRDRLVIPAFGSIYEKLEPYSWPMVRVVTGLLLIPHGYMKLFGGGLDGTIGFLSQLGFEPAAFWGWLIALLEFFGGILLAVGFLTRIVAGMVFGFMAVAAFGVHWGNGFFWTDGGFEYPLMWGVVALAILFRGGGMLSVDRRLSREI
jgi:putative oxidoreductase